jgi:hypothetical protein
MWMDKRDFKFASDKHQRAAVSFSFSLIFTQEAQYKNQYLDKEPT